MMTRKDYVETAQILSEHYPNQPEIVQVIADRFAEYFAKDNPRFDKNRFDNAIRKEN
jgi:hypothetical protein